MEDDPRPNVPAAAVVKLCASIVFFGLAGFMLGEAGIGDHVYAALAIVVLAVIAIALTRRNFRPEIPAVLALLAWAGRAYVRDVKRTTRRARWEK